MTKDLDVGIKFLTKNEKAIKELEQLIKVMQEFESGMKKASISSKAGSTSLGDFSNKAQKAEKITQQLANAETKAANASKKHKNALNDVANATKKTTTATNGLTKSLNVLAGGVSFALIVKGFMDIRKAAIDAVESENLFAESMGRQARVARAFSEELKNATGFNGFGIRKNLGIFNVMIKEMGTTETQAFKMSKALTTLAYDLASFYNLDHETAFAKIRSGISGEAEPLKQLGIVVNETTAKQAALTHGIIKQGEELTESQKVYARYLVIMDSTTTAQGDAIRTADQASNMQRRLASSIENNAIALGERMLPANEKVTKSLLALNDNAGDFVDGNGKQLETTFTVIADTVINTTTAIVGLAKTLDTFTLGGFELTFRGIFGILHSASYSAALLGKSLEKLTIMSRIGGKTVEEQYKEARSKKLVELRGGKTREDFASSSDADNFMKKTWTAADLYARELRRQGDFNKKYNKDLEKIDEEIYKLTEDYNTHKNELFNPKLYKKIDDAKKQTLATNESLYNVNVGEGLILPVNGPVSSPFGKRNQPTAGASTEHKGTDFSIPINTDVSASGGGKIIKVVENDPGLGNYVVVDHGNGVTTLYAHLNKSLVQKDQIVRQGDKIALSGNTGISTGPHLHYEIRKDGVAQNPNKYVDLNSTNAGLPEETKPVDLKYTKQAALDKFEKSLRDNPGQFDLKPTSLKFGEFSLAEDKLKQLGLTDKDIEMVKTKGKELFDGLKELETKYVTFKESQQQKVQDLQEKALDQMIKNRVALEKKLKDIEENTKLSPEQAKGEKAGATDSYNIADQKIRKDLEKDIAQIQKFSDASAQKHLEDRQKKIEAFAEKEIDTRKHSEEEIQKLRLATQEITEDAQTEQLKFEAEASNDRISLIDIETKAQQENITQRIRLITQQKNAAIAKIDEQIKKEKELNSTVESLNKEKYEIELNSVAQIDALEEEQHRNELKRIEKQQEAWKTLFEERLSMLGKIAGFAGKFLGENNILTKVSNFIGSNGSTISSIIGKLTKGRNPVQGAQAEAIPGSGSWFSPNNGNASSPLGDTSSFIPVLGEKGGIKAIFSGKFGENIFGKYSKVAGPLAGMAAGGLTGYSLGKQNLALGIGGGIFSGAMSGASLAGPWGALAGGIAGAGGGLLGWLFGRKEKIQKRDEGIKLGNLEAMFSRVLAGSDYTRSQLAGTVNEGHYLTDFQSTSHQLQSQIGTMQTQIAQIDQQFNGDLYKQRSGEAQQIRNNLVNQANEQIAQLQELQKLNDQKLKERQALLDEVKNQTEKEINDLRTSYTDNPYQFNDAKWNLEMYDSIFRVNQARVNYADDPGLLNLFYQKRQEEARILYREKALGQIEADKNLELLDFEVEFERLQSVDAPDSEILAQNYEKEMIDHVYNIKRMKELFKDNVAMLERINKIDEYKQINIKNELDDALKELEKAEAEKEQQKTRAFEDLDYRIVLENLKSQDAKGPAYTEAEQERQLTELQRFIEESEKLYGDSEEYKTKLLEYEVLARENIIKLSEEAIREEYEQTAQTATSQLTSFENLLEKYSDTQNQFDFVRKKTRQETIDEQLADLEKQIRKQYPELEDVLGNLTMPALDTLSQDDLNDVNKALKSINNFQTSNAYNNVINVNVSTDANAQEIAQAVEDALVNIQMGAQ